jgi:hypothetical protein
MYDTDFFGMETSYHVSTTTTVGGQEVAFNHIRFYVGL